MVGVGIVVLIGRVMCGWRGVVRRREAGDEGRMGARSWCGRQRSVGGLVAVWTGALVWLVASREGRSPKRVRLRMS